MSKRKLSYITIAAIVLTVLGWVLPPVYGVLFPDEEKLLYWGLPTEARLQQICLWLFLISLCLGIAALIIESVRRQKTGIVLCIINIAVFVPSVYSHLPALGTARAYARRTSCASNLKQIQLTLQQYAMDYSGYYPPENGAAGLEYLRKNDYLTDYCMYRCPNINNTTQQRSGQPLTEDTVDYVYVGGLNTKSDPNLPLMYDKPDNHKYFGNVVYANGIVKGVYGNPWTKNIKK